MAQSTYLGLDCVPQFSVFGGLLSFMLCSMLAIYRGNFCPILNTHTCTKIILLMLIKLETSVLVCIKMESQNVVILKLAPAEKLK